MGFYYELNFSLKWYHSPNRSPGLNNTELVHVSYNARIGVFAQCSGGSRISHRGGRQLPARLRFIKFVCQKRIGILRWGGHGMRPRIRHCNGKGLQMLPLDNLPLNSSRAWIMWPLDNSHILLNSTIIIHTIVSFPIDFDVWIIHTFCLIHTLNYSRVRITSYWLCYGIANPSDLALNSQYLRNCKGSCTNSSCHSLFPRNKI